MKSTYIYFSIFIVIIIGGLLIAKNYSQNGSSDTGTVTAFDTFSQCLRDAGAKFYGAYWCPHCQVQKKMLHDSKNLPYIECSTPDGKGQTKQCADANITSYPTWVFRDDSRIEGEITLDELSQKTGCALPS